MIYQPIAEKCCTKCHEWFPSTLEYFHKHRLGLTPKCKSCSCAARRQYRSTHLIQERERDKLAQKARRDAIPPEINREYWRQYRRTNVQHYREYDRARYAANPQKKKECNRKYLVKHPEKKRQWSRLYRIRHAKYIQEHDKIRRSAPDKREQLRAQRRLQAHMRRARQRIATGKCTGADIKLQYEKQQGKCYWCSKLLDQKYHVDHVIPLSRGGSNSPDNIVITCAPCNHKKGNRLPYREWQPPNPLDISN